MIFYFMILCCVAICSSGGVMFRKSVLLVLAIFLLKPAPSFASKIGVMGGLGPYWVLLCFLLNVGIRKIDTDVVKASDNRGEIVTV